jgi:deazaflavin-dependent oxidoreductase (nitroreductase family)
MAMTMPEQEVATWPMPHTEGWRRWLFKSPLLAWRLGLGPIMGRMWAVITTTGRRSGQPRRVVAEYHVVNGTRYVWSAFGCHSDWVRNLEADPHATIQTAGGTLAACARRVTGVDEVVEVYLATRHNPFMWQLLYSVGIQPDPDDVRAKYDRLCLLAFEPTGDRTPLPLKADLVWVLPALGGGLLLALLARAVR